MTVSRGKNIAGGAARLAWLLTATALAVGAAVLLQFDRALQTVRTAREAVAAADEVCNNLLAAFDDDLFRLDSQVQELLDDRDPHSGPATFHRFRSRLTEEIARLPSRPQIVAPVITAAQRLEHNADEFERVRARAGVWRSGHTTVDAAYREARSRADAAISALRSAAESSEGRERLRHLVPRAGDAASPPIDRTRELAAIKAELAELALTCAALVQERDADALADFKDNRFAPSLVRLRRIMAQQAGHAPDDDPLRPELLTAFEAALFGRGYVFDADHQSLVLGEGGLFEAIRAFSLSIGEHNAVDRQSEQILRELHQARLAVSEKSAAEAAALATKVKADLAQARTTTFIGGGVAALAFVGLAFRIASRLKRLVDHVQQANESLARANELAQGANRAKTEFLANMSHEIRTPMTAILGYADLLADPAQPAPDRAESVQTIRKNGEHLLSIINDILDLSKIEAGRMTVEPQETSAVQIVEDVLSLMRPRAAAKGISLRPEYRFPLPRTIRTDPLRLKQILLNLLGNAIKFTQDGGVSITVALVEPSAGRDAIRFEVADTGIGMNPDQVRRLFQPFSQVDGSSTRRYGGTGLGLAIGQRLAHLLGGEITVQSRPGDGSTFTLHIDPGPLRKSQWVHSRDGTQHPPAPRPTTATLRARILLAEDGPDNQRLIAFHLRRAGAAVEIAENGRVALERALPDTGNTAPFDLILMDMQMPELDGYAATLCLRQRGYHGPIIALTAHAMPGDREKCLGAGCNDYLTKPVDPTKLIATCLSYLPESKAAGRAAA